VRLINFGLCCSISDLERDGYVSLKEKLNLIVSSEYGVVGMEIELQVGGTPQSLEL